MASGDFIMDRRYPPRRHYRRSAHVSEHQPVLPPKPSVWRRASNWVFHYPIRASTAIVLLLGAAFVLTAIFGSVDDEDVARFFGAYRKPTIGEEPPILVHIRSKEEFIPIQECHVSRDLYKKQPIYVQNIRIANWFGEKMHTVLALSERIIGFFTLCTSLIRLKRSQNSYVIRILATRTRS
jgi:hypothetical protein